jgi:hypothetical protein
MRKIFVDLTFKPNTKIILKESEDRDRHMITIPTTKP